MPIWTEYEDAFAVKLFRDNLHPKSMFEAELDGGILVCFGEPKSKWKSGRYKLAEVVFDKSRWTYDEARGWWSDHTVLAFKRGKYDLDHKLMPVDEWFEFGDGDLYVFVCWRGEKNQYSPLDYINGRVEGFSNESPHTLCPSCGNPHIEPPPIDSSFSAFVKAKGRGGVYSDQGEQLIQDILSIPGQKIVTITIFSRQGAFGQAFDIDTASRIGYSDTHTLLFREAIGLAFDNDAGLIIRQFLDFGVNKTCESGGEIYVPRKNLYGVVVGAGQYRFLSANEVDLISNTDAASGELLEPEEYVFYCGFPGEEVSAGSPWDDLEL